MLSSSHWLSVIGPCHVLPKMRIAYLPFCKHITLPVKRGQLPANTYIHTYIHNQCLMHVCILGHKYITTAKNIRTVSRAITEAIFWRLNILRSVTKQFCALLATAIMRTATTIMRSSVYVYILYISGVHNVSGEREIVPRIIVNSVYKHAYT